MEPEDPVQIRFLCFVVVFKCSLACSQGSFYTDQFAFRAACQNLAGMKQAISFSSLQPGWWSDSLTLSNVTFSGHLVARGQGDSIAIANEASLNNYDMDVPMSIHFETGALAFGADFSSTGTTIYDPLTLNTTRGQRQPFPGDIIPENLLNAVDLFYFNAYLPPLKPPGACQQLGRQSNPKIK